MAGKTSVTFLSFSRSREAAIDRLNLNTLTPLCVQRAKTFQRSYGHPGAMSRETPAAGEYAANRDTNKRPFTSNVTGLYL